MDCVINQWSWTVLVPRLQLWALTPLQDRQQQPLKWMQYHLVYPVGQLTLDYY